MKDKFTHIYKELCESRLLILESIEDYEDEPSIRELIKRAQEVTEAIKQLEEIENTMNMLQAKAFPETEEEL